MEKIQFFTLLSQMRKHIVTAVVYRRLYHEPIYIGLALKVLSVTQYISTPSFYSVLICIQGTTKISLVCLDEL